MPERVITPIVVRRFGGPGSPFDQTVECDLLVESSQAVLEPGVVRAIFVALGEIGVAASQNAVPAETLQPGDRLTLRSDGSIRCEESTWGQDHNSDDVAVTVELAVVGGSMSGARMALGSSSCPSRVSVGRGLEADVRIFDPRVSALHATVEVAAEAGTTITDLSSANGTFINEEQVSGGRHLLPGDVVRVGATEFEVRAAPNDDRPVGLARRGITAFNRPPRHFDRAIEPQITPPKPPPPSVGRAPFRVTAVVVPMAFAVVMVVLTKQIVFAAFAAMSPVMMAANTISDRRSNRDRARRERARFRTELVGFASELSAAEKIVRANRSRAFPDLAETLRRAELPSRRLWERRRDHADFMRLRLGRGDFRWSVPLVCDVPLGCEEIQSILNSYVCIANTAIDVDLGHGAVLGLSGLRESTLRLARSIIAQVVCHHGPADVRIVAALDGDRLDDWDWLKWLPHLDREEGGRAVAIGVEEISLLAKHFVSGPDSKSRSNRATTEPHTLVILDVDALSMSRLPALSSWLERSDHRCSIMVLAPAMDLLPSSCSTVVSMPNSGEPLANVTEPASGRSLSGVLVNGLTAALAAQTARRLSRFSDPESKTPGASLPRTVSLSSLLDLPTGASDETLAAELDRRWSANLPGRSPAAPIGVSESGPMQLDLGRDGPHGLIGGTTGAGKSELLRSIVVSLALQASPQDLTFVLIDYKGGSAFDECAKLPHVVGMVTDLDEALSARAVVCLEAELRYREQVLRTAGTSDRDSYARIGSPDGPLPRLVIVVDEFAALKNELPEFIDALVDVAQRGRSLGVHLLLATQRPAGVVSDVIRANTELKIGLRMQEPSDSIDVIGSPDAAFLPRTRHGMVLVRFGTEAPMAFQAAYTGLPATAEDHPVRVSEFRLRNCEQQSAPVVEPAYSETELQVLVRCAILAHQRRHRDEPHRGEPRRPWPDPLPESVAFSELHGAVNSVATDQARCADTAPAVSPIVGIVDNPANQCRGEFGWDLDRGNLFLIGARRNDTASALTSIGVALAHSNAPERMHLFGVKSQTSPIDLLADLPHVGDIVATSDRPRLLRLVRELSAELTRRSNNVEEVGDSPAIVVLIDSLGSLKLELDDPGLAVSPWDQLLRVFAEGPRVGIVSAATFDRPSLVSGPIAALAEQRWLFQLTDRLDYSLFGLRGSDVGPLGPMRCVDAQTNLVAQICSVVEADLTSSWPFMMGGQRPTEIRILPTAVETTDLGAVTSIIERPWTIPVGMSDATLGPAFVEAHTGEHVLVTGPSRSGRSTTLACLAENLHGHARTIMIAPPRSPLHTVADAEVFLRHDEVGRIPHLLDETRGPVVVLIDDAELIDDVGGVLTNLIVGEHNNLMIVAAVRPEILRTNYSHWSRQLRRSRLAILLRPNEIDAEFAGIAIPRRGLPVETGRGFLAQNGQLDLVQFCLPRLAPLAGAA